MTPLLVAMEDRVLLVQPDGALEQQLVGNDVTSVAVDPRRTRRLYAGTDGAGIWRSDDGGHRWDPAGELFRGRDVTALAVSASGPGDTGWLYAGTEPSALFRSHDGGDTWEELTGFQALPSASTWSFPPRPDTHHVRWIAPDPAVPDRLFVAIEAGALIRSRDGGRTWEDRTRGSPYDTHTLALHPQAPGRLYSAAGDGYFESRDGGETWKRPRAGLEHGYLVGVTVHPEDPETVLVSAAPGPWKAYASRGAESYVYRRTRDGRWTTAGMGLPEARGTTVSALAASRAEPGTVFAANNRGIFTSGNFGLTWERLRISWPDELQTQWAAAIVCVETG